MPTARKWGIAVLLVSLLGLPASALVALLTVNACGMFADGCDKYGQTAPAFPYAVAGLVLCVVGVAAGLGLIVFAKRPTDTPADPTPT